MEVVENLHDRAMDLAESAFIARRGGKDAEAARLLREAYEAEREAALAFTSELEEEPTRSVLLRSAASLAFQCGEHREAERLINIALLEEPPSQIADELRSLWDEVQFGRHTSLEGIDLSYNQLQMSLWGGDSVGPGIVKTDEFIDRIEFFKKLVIRTVERLSGVSYRSGGKAQNAVRNKYPIFISVARAQSYAVTIQVGNQTQLALPGFDDPVNVIDELLDCMGMLNEGNIETLHRKFKSTEYFANFVSLARKIAPDGERVGRVGIASKKYDAPRYINLKYRNDLIPPPKVEVEEDVEVVQVTIEGYLRFADATGVEEESEIRLVDDQGNKHVIDVPASIMNDIVRPLWDYKVVVDGRRVGDRIKLDDIEKAD